MTNPFLLTIDEWLATLSTRTRAKAKGLIKQMQLLGAPDAAEWGRSELLENKPQFTRFLLLQRLWKEIDTWRDTSSIFVYATIGEAEGDSNAPFADAGRVMKRMLDAGITPQEIGQVARMVAYET